MAKLQQRVLAEKMRREGQSYSTIQKQLGVSKSTLSSWLKGIPLSDTRLRELRDFNPVRIEKTRQTKLLKKQTRRDAVLEKVKHDFKVNKTPLFKEGFYLYWGEGTKTAEYTVALTSSDPAIIKCFLSWLQILGVSKADMRVKLHIYSDQIETDVLQFWIQKTKLLKRQFYKSYIKKTFADRKTYKSTFGNGTCSVLYHDRDMYEYVMAGIRYLREVNE
jgi:predicted transcriptional regulator